MGCIFSKRSAAAGDDGSPAAAGGTAEKPSGTKQVTTTGDGAQPSPENQRRTSSPIPFSPKVPSGWPDWLIAVAGEALGGWAPRRANSFQKLDKIGQGTYSNVYKARDLVTGRTVALKKVRFDAGEAESVRFMAREITLLRRLGDHPNIVRLEGLVTSRVSQSLYLIFEYMEHDLAGLAAHPDVSFSEPQVKCYMKQLLTGLKHCHTNGVLHRDIKGSNLLLDNDGVLKIADFGLASTYDPSHKQPMTSRVVTLWYRPPELLLGATYYGVGVDLWSAGCILAELLAGKPILPGRTEVEQLHRIFKLCGSPSDSYWKSSKLPHATTFKPKQPYKACITETFKDFPPSSLSLIKTLLAFDPEERRTATAALESEFFTTKPYACEPSSLPKYPPSKELDAKLRDEKARRKKALDGQANGDTTKRARVHHRRSRAVPAPEANAELKVNLDRRRLITRVNVTSKSEKFPPPHQDGAVGFPLNPSHTTASFVASDTSFASSIFESKEHKVPMQNGGTKKTNKYGPKMPPSGLRPLRPTSVGQLMDLNKNISIHKRVRGKELEVFGGGK